MKRENCVNWRKHWIMGMRQYQAMQMMLSPVTFVLPLVFLSGVSLPWCLIAADFHFDWRSLHWAHAVRYVGIYCVAAFIVPALLFGIPLVTTLHLRSIVKLTR